MAECIPDRLPPRASQGEIRVFNILRELPDDCLVYYEPLIQNRCADFIVLIPNLGLLVVEVKGWYPGNIQRGDLENVVVERGGLGQQEAHPIRQARQYVFDLIDQCKKYPRLNCLLHTDGPHLGRLIFPVGSFCAMSNMTRAQIHEHDLAALFPTNKVVARDELSTWEQFQGNELVQSLRRFFDPWWPIPTMSGSQVNTIRAIIHPEVLLLPLSPSAAINPSTGATIEEPLKVLDLRQENHARQIGHGHRVIYGVPGSGKTVLLVARAKLAALSRPDQLHLFLCYNVALAAYLKRLLLDYPNVIVRNFEGWGKDQGVTRHWHQEEDDDSFGKRLLDHMRAGRGDSMRFSSVMIDEAQDFAASWFQCAIESMQEQLDGDLVVVGDGNQGLYRRRPFTWASVGIQAVGRTINAKLDLDKAYRSSREIMTLARAFAAASEGTDSEQTIVAMGIDPSKCVRESGYHPMLVLCTNKEDECRQASSITQNLLRGMWFGSSFKGPLSPSEIGILYRGANQADKSLLRELERSINSFSTAIWINKDPGSRERIVETGVKIQTIHSAKGLQYRAVVILWGGMMPASFDDTDERTERNLMLVGLTRAEDFLAVLHSASSIFIDELLQTGIASV